MVSFSILYPYISHRSIIISTLKLCVNDYAAAHAHVAHTYFSIGIRYTRIICTCRYGFSLQLDLLAVYLQET